ncbi:FAD/NAD(P)-binding domain-containing protein [Penicillium nucicola]|uniref:FAD/NAD(P)-binding domain-containing protein n=1 Tax=Penicillium nucicola TaxID=1850975 RepID=UPI002545A0F1|nr:FAD/NAD(P)-binding domain-containing protein [Penicillium nucicola]KAJ5770867.1 FAD/NAD(P)-binding domain-containing protein [Penicillium nucicola]
MTDCKTLKMRSRKDSDVIIVGAGLSGITALYQLRKLGLSCSILEKGSQIGGVWHWNCYPGARMDSGVPSYEFSIPECREGWKWSSTYPDYVEIRKYLKHCDSKLGITEHVIFGTTVQEANFESEPSQWVVRCDDGQVFGSKYLVMAIGLTSIATSIDEPELDRFKGQIIYPSTWPKFGVNPKDKHVAVIGSGCTGVQIVQEWADQAKSLTLFQRTPNTALPMRLKPLDNEMNRVLTTRHREFMEKRKKIATGMADKKPISKASVDDCLDDRHAFFETLFQKGGLHFWLSSYGDISDNLDANREVYDFWAKKTRARISDPRKRELLAPTEPKHLFGAKRPALEQRYFEKFNQESVDVVDVSTNQIHSFTEDGIITNDQVLRPVDIIVPCVGFLSPEEIVLSIDIRGIDGVRLAEVWGQEVSTYLGMMCHGFPNLFILNGPQSPGELGNAPTVIEVQVEWLSMMVAKIEQRGLAPIHPTRSAMHRWKDLVQDNSKKPLATRKKSRFMIFNKITQELETVYYGGGIPMYMEELEKSFVNWDWESNFHVSSQTVNEIDFSHSLISSLH